MRRRARLARPLIALAALALPFAGTAGPVAAQGEVYRVPVEGVIEMGVAPFIERAIREAEQNRAVAVILDIDTPGGRVDAAQRIGNAVRDTDIPVYAYVNRHAISAGAMISLATQRIYMRPGSLIGASTPVTGEGETASEKMVSVMRAEFRTLAQERGLDPEIAASMVDPDIEVEGVIERGKLLTLSTSEAVELGFAEEVADWDALLAAVGADGRPTVTMQLNWAERVVRFITHPLVAPFLLSIGFLGLLIEIKTPSFGIAGAIGLGSLGLFFGGHMIIGLAGWEVLILLAAGVVLLIVEAVILPGFGVAGILGALAVLAAVFMSMIGRFPTTGDLMVAANVIAASMLLVAFIGWQLLKRLPRDRRTRRIFLTQTTARDQGYVSSTARGELVGTEGTALTDLRPAGTGRFGDENIDVVSDGPWINRGAPIRILRSEGYRHVVREVSAPAETASTGENRSDTPADG
jgi:membrane-bound serine protease (ClpP class)